MFMKQKENTELNGKENGNMEREKKKNEQCNFERSELTGAVDVYVVCMCSMESSEARKTASGMLRV